MLNVCQTITFLKLPFNLIYFSISTIIKIHLFHSSIFNVLDAILTKTGEKKCRKKVAFRLFSLLIRFHLALIVSLFYCIWSNIQCHTHDKSVISKPYVISYDKMCGFINPCTWCTLWTAWHDSRYMSFENLRPTASI